MLIYLVEIYPNLIPAVRPTPRGSQTKAMYKFFLAQGERRLFGPIHDSIQQWIVTWRIIPFQADGAKISLGSR
jgi:hypothetical protein